MLRTNAVACVEIKKPPPKGEAEIADNVDFVPWLPLMRGLSSVARLGERLKYRQTLTKIEFFERFLSLSQPLVPRVCQLPHQREPG